MSTLEINKMVAALLTVGVVAGFSAFLAGVIMHPHELAEPSYSVAGAVSEDEPRRRSRGRRARRRYCRHAGLGR